MPRGKRNVAQPGAQPEVEQPGESNVDEAIDAARSGRARRIVKPKPVVEASPIQGDPERPATAAVNAKPGTSYAAAMAAKAAGTLRRSVLTEQGWVYPELPEPPKAVR